MKASVLYLVRFRISPSEGGPFLNWLERGHIAEVIQEPGFIWARHYRLEGLDEYGWNRYLTIYGIDRQDSLDRYFDSSRRKHFLQEAERFKSLHKSDRLFGTLDLEISSPPHIGDEAQAIYCLRFSLRTNGLQTLSTDLSHEHIAEVIKNPGFIWARRLHLYVNKGDKSDQWMLIYGQSSLGFLKKYLGNPIRKKGGCVQKSLTNELQTEESTGTLELALEKD